MMDPVLITIVFLCLMGVVAVGIYVAFYGSHRVLDERFNDLAIRLRLEHGGLSNQDIESDTFVRSMFDWVLRRVPAPKPDSPKGEKLSQTLVQAGFIRSSALQTFHAVRVASVLGAGVVVLVLALTMGLPTASAIFYAICAGLLGAVIPSFVLSRQAAKRQQEIGRQVSDVLDLLWCAWRPGWGFSKPSRSWATKPSARTRPSARSWRWSRARSLPASRSGWRCATWPSAPRSRTSSRSPPR